MDSTSSDATGSHCLANRICPDRLKNFWPGHAHTHISERYAKLIGEREYRLEWAERIGLGFKIPGSLDYLDYFAWCRMPRKSLIYMVDETGVEPATSSLRTMRV